MTPLRRRISIFLFFHAFILISHCFGDYAQVLEAIDQNARLHATDAMIVVKEGQVLYEMSSGEDFDTIAAWSITKSFISVGIGFLYDEGKIDPDQYVSDFLPGWDTGEKSRVTIRHLLTHTSGLDHRMEVTDSESILKGDCLAIAGEKKVVYPPGTTFHYNNFAVNLLSGIIEQVSGERTDFFIKRKLLDHLGITNYKWDVDEAGHAFGMCGLHLRADELIKFGEFILNRGEWDGKRLLSEDWIDQMLGVSVEVSAGPNPKSIGTFTGCGFLWWLNKEEPRFYAAVGLMGQYCAIFPDRRLVVVRQHDYRRHTSLTEVDETVKYRAFFEDIKQLIKALDQEP